MSTIAWVIGKGGMLGSRCCQEMAGRSTLSCWESPVASYSWGTENIHGELAESAQAFLEYVQTHPQPWIVVWAAGAGVVGSTSESLAQETVVWRGLLAALEPLAALGKGTIFFSSSAGTVYGHAAETLTEHSALAPISPYGKEKVIQEGILREWAEAHTGVTAIIGRISNLYGEEQNLSKPQGLISHLVRSSLHHRPLHLFVSIDTIRDYVYVGDCARAIVDCLEIACAGKAPAAVWVKLFASERVTTIGELLALMGKILKRAPRVTYGQDARSAVNVRTLRFHSVECTQVAPPAETALLTGMHRVYAHQLALFAKGKLA